MAKSVTNPVLIFGGSYVTAAINVLPPQSYLQACKQNVTDVDKNSKDMITFFNKNGSSFNVASGLQSLQDILHSSSLAVFYCYYAVVNPTGFISNQVKPFAPTTIAWNLLYSLGYLYTDSYNVVKTATNGSSTDVSAKVIGTSLGDATMRPLYSHYLDRFT